MNYVILRFPHINYIRIPGREPSHNDTGQYVFYILFEIFANFIYYIQSMLFPNLIAKCLNILSVLDFFSIYFSNVIPFPYSASPCSLTHPFPMSSTGILLSWGNEPSQFQVPLLSLIFYQAILCYSCCWSYEILHVYSLIGGYIPGSSGVWVSSYCCSSMGLEIP